MGSRPPAVTEGRRAAALRSSDVSRYDDRDGVGVIDAAQDAMSAVEGPV
jgi:hypothetical protein